MASRRQEKVAKLIKQEVSEIIREKLSDPRIQGLISVTHVEIMPDLKKADVYLSIMGESDGANHAAFTAIEHAGRKIQKELGSRMETKFCPHLHFHLDEKLKNTLETFRLIEEARNESRPQDTDGNNNTGLE